MAGGMCIWATQQPWRSTFRVSAHHYARALVERGWRVAWLSHPISPLHLLSRAARRTWGGKWRTWRAGGATDLGGALFHYVPLTLLPPHRGPLLGSRRVLDRWPRHTIPRLERVLDAAGFADPDLVVVDSERFGFLFDRPGAATRVLRIVDDIGGFRATAPAWLLRQRELIARADHVVATSAVLAEDLARAGARDVHYVPNGVEIDHFRAHAPEPAEYRAIAPPRAVYAGALDDWFDDGLLERVAELRSDVAFVLIGSGGTARASAHMRRRANVHILGPRAYERLPGYLAHADVGIIPFRPGRLTRSVHPIKLYEYMACGLPVVATRSEELEHLGSPALLCDGADEFAEGLAAAIGTADRARLAQFAECADWRRRAELLFHAIGNGSVVCNGAA